jgi:SHS2 domain-containing protein
MTYRFLDDIATADVAFAAEGATREELCSACAEALLATMVDDPALIERRQEIAIAVTAAELDLLLYALLAELVFYKDARRLLLHADNVRIWEENEMLRLETRAQGEEIAADRHRLLVDVKGVTLHRFAVVCRDVIWQATVVLDV